MQRPCGERERQEWETESQLGWDSGNGVGGDVGDMGLVLWTLVRYWSFSYKSSMASHWNDVVMSAGQSTRHTPEPRLWEQNLLPSPTASFPWSRPL